jgi:hypothetical protein
LLGADQQLQFSRLNRAKYGRPLTLAGREDRRRHHLIEQRLKYVVVAAVDQYDLGIGASWSFSL